MSEDRPQAPQFTLAAGAVALLGCLLAVAAPYLGDAPASFRGSLTAAGLVGTVFAAQQLRLIREEGRPRLPAATITMLFGLSFLVAPLLYSEVGFVVTAVAQSAGLLTAAFGGYTAVEGLEAIWR